MICFQNVKFIFIPFFFFSLSSLFLNSHCYLALPIFKTGWEFEPGTINNTYIGVFQGNVYPFGLDYV